jgi:phospholipase C
MLKRVERAGAQRRLAQRGPAVAPRPEMSMEPGADRLPQVEHIVILMMENHSYDNYLGMLAGRGDGFTLGPDGTPDASNDADGGTAVPAWHLDSTVQQPKVPTQSWNATHIQWNEGGCDGFVASIERTVPGGDSRIPMGYWTERDLPFYYSLARTFPLATRWFSSCLGPTFPNRRFMTAGTANGLIDDLPFCMIDYPQQGTLFDLLTAHGISWVNYHHLSPVRVRWRMLAHARGLGWLRLLGGLLAGIWPQLRPAMQSKVQATADLYPLGFLRVTNHLRPIEDFFAAAAAGRLPSVSIVDPDFVHGSEENPQDVQNGEAFASQVVNAVMSGKGWPKTLLIWLYDEHGGYYDHVPPPEAPAPDDVPAQNPMRRFALLRLLGFTGFGKVINRADDGPATYTRLGFRVPAVIVSPYARPNYTTSQTYDHTSVLKLIEHKWNLPPLTHRDAAATAPLDTLDFTNPPAFLTPPTLAPPARPAPQ